MATLQKGISAIRIYDETDTPIMVVDISSSCKRVREIQKSDYIQLSWESDEYRKLSAGCHVYYGTQARDKDNPPFYLMNPYEPTHKTEDTYTYEPQFHARQMLWQKYPVCVYTYTDIGDIKGRELEWSFLGTPADALSMVVQSVKNETGHVLNTSYIGSVSEKGSSAVELSGQSDSIVSILNKIAEAMDTEWQYNEELNRIELGEVRLSTEQYPIISLKVGDDCENPSVNQSQEDYYNRFYVFGSDKNITQQKVTEITNSAVKKRLPLNTTKYPGGFMDLDILARTDLKGNKKDGFYLPNGTIYQPTQTDKGRIYPKGLYFDEVYPATKFYVKSVLKNGLDGKQYLKDENGNIIGDTFYVAVSLTKGGVLWNDFTLSSVLAGETLQMYFTSGILNGRTFSLSAHIKYDGTNTYFYLIPDQNGSLTTPNQYLIPSVDDEVTFFGYDFGQIGIDNAKAQLEKTATKYLYELVQSNTTYTIKGNTIKFERNTKRDVRFALMPMGQQIMVDYGNGNTTDVLRVIKAETALDIPSEMTITASAKVQPQGALSSLTAQVELNKRTEERKIEEYRQTALSYANRSIQQVYETMSQINNYFGAELQTTQSMQTLVGDESLQFVFSENVDFDPLKNPVCNYDNTNKRFQLRMYEDDTLYFYVKHMTIGITEISSELKTDTERKVWKLTNQYTKWQNDDSAMVYLECPKETSRESPAVARLFCTDRRMSIEDGNFYYLLLGFVSSQDTEGQRSFSQMYGYTEILPGRVTTDKIVSRDGKTYFDIANGEIGGNINFKDSVMAETIFIKDGDKVDTSGNPYYIGGLSGAPDLPVLFCGIDPSVTDTAEVERIARDEPLPIKIMKDGYGSNIGCLNIADKDYVEVNSERGDFIRISNRTIAEENAELSYMEGATYIQPALTPLQTSAVSPYLFLDTQQRTCKAAWDGTAKTAFNATDTHSLAISITNPNTGSIALTSTPYLVVKGATAYSGETWKVEADVTARLIFQCRIDNGEWDKVCAWTKKKHYSKTFTKTDGNTPVPLGEDIKISLSLDGCEVFKKGKKVEVRTRLEFSADAYRVYPTHTSTTMTDPRTCQMALFTLSTLSKVGFHVAVSEAANVIAIGGMTSNIDSDNFFKLYPAEDGRMLSFFRARPVLDVVRIETGDRYVELRKWCGVVMCSMELTSDDRNTTKYNLPTGYRPAARVMIPADFEGTDGDKVGFLGYTRDGVLKWYTIPVTGTYRVYATAMWLTTD